MRLELVADTNIIVAAILSNGITRNTIFRANMQIHCPSYTREELNEHKQELVGKLGIDAADYEKTLDIIFSNIHEVEEGQYIGLKEKAKKLSPDADDWPFFALAICKKCPIWSNDKKLKKQAEVEVIGTEELLKRLASL